MEKKLLSCITRGNLSPQGKVKVLFSCHEADFEAFFDSMTKKIFQYVDCAIYYSECSIEEVLENQEEYESQISDMSLLVIPVTEKVIEDRNKAIEIDLKYAIDHYIPILPVLEEDVSEKAYQKVFGTIQYLSEKACDATTLSFEAKLENFLHSVLVSNEVLMQIKEAFEGQIFLSYRKTDRIFANKIMTLIHAIDYTRDVAIWYDEDITIGERFDEEIMTALGQSQLFVLCVTKMLMTLPNYVISTEIPKAFELNLPVLAMEMEEPDQNLIELRDGDSYVSKQQLGKLEEAVSRYLGQLKAVNRNDTPEHLYLMGMAYLYGIGVEHDAKKAIILLKESSDHKYHPATKRLISVYTYGSGVPVDKEKAMDLYMELIKQLKMEALDSEAFAKKKELFDVILEAAQLIDGTDLSLCHNYNSWVRELTMSGIRLVKDDRFDIYSVFILVSLLALINQDEEEVFCIFLSLIEDILNRREEIFSEREEYLAGQAYVCSRLAVIFTQKHTGKLTYLLGDKAQYHKEVADRGEMYLKKSMTIMKGLLEKDPFKWKGRYADTLFDFCKNVYSINLEDKDYCQMMEEVLSRYRELYAEGKTWYKEKLASACLEYAQFLQIEIYYTWKETDLSVISDYEEKLIGESSISKIPASVKLYIDEFERDYVDVRRVKKIYALLRYAIGLFDEDTLQDAAYGSRELVDSYLEISNLLALVFEYLYDNNFDDLCLSLAREYVTYFYRYVDAMRKIYDYRFKDLVTVSSGEKKNCREDKEETLLELERKAYARDPFADAYNFSLRLEDSGCMEAARMVMAALYEFLDYARKVIKPHLTLLVTLEYASIAESEDQSRDILLKYLDYYDYSKITLEDAYFNDDHCECLKQHYNRVKDITTERAVFLKCDQYLQWMENQYKYQIEKIEASYELKKLSLFDSYMIDEVSSMYALRADCKAKIGHVTEADAYYQKAIDCAMKNMDLESEDYLVYIKDYIAFLKKEGLGEEAQYWTEFIE